ncbi:hypothetical protein [Saccharopolyspora sp. NPDC050642]|uniref:hypothetical protein n=1 Tax=Saccharopolyspora sp. NPDC050642 TaxID=3157099 RepID=UPI0033DC52BD
MAWTAPQAGEDSVERALRDIHHVMVMSELDVVAEHLQLRGEPVFTADSNAFAARLAYDG